MCGTYLSMKMYSFLCTHLYKTHTRTHAHTTRMNSYTQNIIFNQMCASLTAQILLVSRLQNWDMTIDHYNDKFFSLTALFFCLLNFIFCWVPCCFVVVAIIIIFGALDGNKEFNKSISHWRVFVLRVCGVSVRAHTAYW